MNILSKILTAAVGLLALCSCSMFLEKPDTTGTVDLDAVFSTTKNAQATLMSCYRNVLQHGLPGGMGSGTALTGPFPERSAAVTTGTAATTSSRQVFL